MVLESVVMVSRSVDVWFSSMRQRREVNDAVSVTPWVAGHIEGGS